MEPDNTHPAVDVPHSSVKQYIMPALPAETWLQILENTQDIESLWSSVRLVSKKHQAFVERVILSHFLPQASVSFSLPRRHPRTGALVYRGQIPGAELSMHYAYTNDEKTHVVLRTSNVGHGGVSIEGLNGVDYLSQRRLQDASSWLWFGTNRARGVAINVRKELHWDENEKTWIWIAEWRSLVGAYVQAKTLKRSWTRLQKKKSSRRL
jgi:hypothetical protein